MFLSWKAVEQMVADTFLRNPGNPPVYPLRYEKEKKGPKNVVWREKWLERRSPRERRAAPRVGGALSAISREFRSQEGTSFLLGGTYGCSQEAESKGKAMQYGAPSFPTSDHSIL